MLIVFPLWSLLDHFPVDRDNDNDTDNCTEERLLSEDIVKTVKTALTILGIDSKPTSGAAQTNTFASLFHALIVMTLCVSFGLYTPIHRLEECAQW